MRRVTCLMIALILHSYSLGFAQDTLPTDAGIRACDRLAAYKYDRKRVAPAVEKIDDLGMALQACEGATHFFPHLARFRVQLARVYLDLDDYAKALQNANHAIQIDPSYSAAYVVKSGAEWGLGDHHAEFYSGKKAAELGNIEGLAIMGSIYVDGTGPYGQDCRNGMQMIKQAIANGSLYGRDIMDWATEYCGQRRSCECRSPCNDFFMGSLDCYKNSCGNWCRF